MPTRLMGFFQACRKMRTENNNAKAPLYRSGAGDKAMMVTTTRVPNQAQKGKPTHASLNIEKGNVFDHTLHPPLYSIGDDNTGIDT